ncbi:MAG: M48 family metallopeptidase [Clostridia bacterium]
MNLVKERNQVITYKVDKMANDNMYISIQNGEVVVKAPWYLTSQRIQEVVEEKTQWIIQKLKEYEQANKSKKETLQYNAVKILGFYYDLKIEYKMIKMPKLEIDNRQIQIILPNKYKNIDSKETLKILIEKMYHKIASDEIERAMEKTRLMLGIAPEDFEIVRIKNMLGKCLDNKTILINPDIASYSRRAIDYIVLHEFCHLKYKTHSKGFYKMLEQYMPDYKRYADEISNWQY